MNMTPANKAHFEAEKEAIHLILTGIGDEIYSTVDACQTAQEIMSKSLCNNQIVSDHFIHQLVESEDNDPEQAQRDKDMQKNLALIAKYFKKIYKPTNKNLKTSLNLKNKNVDTTLRKPKRVKDSAYHKEKMLLCKKAEQGVPLQAEQYDWLVDTDKEIDEQESEAHYSYMEKIQEVPTADSGTNSKPLEQNDQNDVESDDERVALANLITNLKLDVDEKKKIQKKLKKANTTLAQELKECKTILAETSKTLGESMSVRDSFLVALQTKQTEFEKYKAFNDRIIDYDKLERKLNETIGQLAQKDIEIKEGLKTKAYEISVVKEKYDELIKHSLLTKSHYEGLVKQKTKVITDLKLREEHDIDKMFSMEKQLKFLNEIVYKRSQSIQTIHMMAPKVSTYNGRPTFANPRYHKQAQSKIPCLYAFPYGQSTHANRLIHNGEETLALERDSRSKLNKDLVHPYDYTTLNKILDNAWIKHSKDQFCAPTAQDIEILIQTCLMPLAIKTQNDGFIFVHELKQEMHADLKYVESLEKEIDELEYDKAEFLNMYEKHSISLEITLQKCKEQVKNDTVLNDKASNVFRKEREQYIKIQDLKAQLQDKNIAISELKKLIEKGKGKYVDTKFDKPSVVRQPNAQRIPKPSVLGKPAPFSNSLERIYFSKTNLVPKTNVSEGLSKPITAQTLPQTARQAFAPILGYGDLVQGNITINRVYYVEGLNHILYSVGQFCDADLEVAFWKSTCFVRDLQGNDLLIGNHGSDLYTISLQESTSSTPLCLMAKASPT
nr:integrase, catalytic region, zinc finger, CCHC-type, peptidase aspartic, catalytic [Tanacetum cinerariifolium]